MLTEESSIKGAKKDQNQSKKKALALLKHNTETLAESNDVLQKKPDRKKKLRFDEEDDIFEIPATPPSQEAQISFDAAKDSSSFKSNQSFMEPIIKTPFPILKNKALSKIKNDDRRSLNVSMLSSPSIMSTKPKRTSEPSSSGSSMESNQKSSNVFNADEMFEGLKNSENMTPKQNESERKQSVPGSTAKDLPIPRSSKKPKK